MKTKKNLANQLLLPLMFQNQTQPHFVVFVCCLGRDCRFYLVHEIVMGIFLESFGNIEHGDCLLSHHKSQDQNQLIFEENVRMVLFRIIIVHTQLISLNEGSWWTS